MSLHDYEWNLRSRQQQRELEYNYRQRGYNAQDIASMHFNTELPKSLKKDDEKALLILL